MNRNGNRAAKKAFIVGLAALCLPVLLVSGLQLEAHEYKKGDLLVHHPWARPTADTAQNAAVYATLRNGGSQPDTLLAVKTPIAPRIELHNTLNEDGIMKMRPMTAGVEIPAGGEVKLEPGGMHVMVLGITAPLKENARHPITFVFKNAGEIAGEIAVEKQPAGKPDDTHKHH